MVSLTGLARADAPLIVVLGDSLSAGYGVPQGQGWVDLLVERLARRGYAQRVINASISGDTTSGGRVRLARLLERETSAVLVIELGANDGLRGISPRVMGDNLRAMIGAGKASGAKVLLLGMRLPPNYGPEFERLFHQTYYEVAEAEQVPLLPFFLDGVAQDRSLMQADELHPNAAAQPRLLDNVWPLLEPLLAD